MDAADSCAAGSSRQVPMSLFCETPRQVSLIHAPSRCHHSVSKHPTWCRRRFDTLPLSATASRTRRLKLRHWLAGSPHTSGRNEFVILRTDRSPPAAPHPASRSDAVAVGYRPESVCLKRTFTSQTQRAFRRTNPLAQRRYVQGRVAYSLRPLFSSEIDTSPYTRCAITKAAQRVTTRI
jgi:hypothetical protein